MSCKIHWLIGLDKVGQKANYLAMLDESFITEAEEYCAAAGISPSTLAVRALNNSRFFNRAARQREKANEAIERLRAYMAANPAQTPAGAK